jgi:hypothetical protein
LLHTNAGGLGFLPDVLTVTGTKRRYGFANGVVLQRLARLDWHRDSYPAFSDKPHFPFRRLSVIANRSRQRQPARAIHS